MCIHIFSVIDILIDLPSLLTYSLDIYACVCGGGGGVSVFECALLPFSLIVVKKFFTIIEVKKNPTQCPPPTFFRSWYLLLHPTTVCVTIYLGSATDRSLFAIRIHKGIEVRMRTSLKHNNIILLHYI